jgi:hypothetical protein
VPVVFPALRPLRVMISGPTNLFEGSYDQFDVVFLEARVGFGRFRWLVGENDTEAFLEFALGVCITIRIL